MNYTCLLLSARSVVFGQLLLFSLLRSTFLHFCDFSPSPSLSSSLSLSIHLFIILFLSLTPCWESDTQTQTPSLLPTFVSFLLASDLLSGFLPCSFSLCFSHTSSSPLVFSLLCLLQCFAPSLYLCCFCWPFSVQSCISCSFPALNLSFSSLLSLVHPPSPLFLFLAESFISFHLHFFPAIFLCATFKRICIEDVFWGCAAVSNLSVCFCLSNGKCVSVCVFLLICSQEWCSKFVVLQKNKNPYTSHVRLSFSLPLFISSSNSWIIKSRRLVFIAIDFLPWFIIGRRITKSQFCIY